MRPCPDTQAYTDPAGDVFPEAGDGAEVSVTGPGGGGSGAGREAGDSVTGGSSEGGSSEGGGLDGSADGDSEAGGGEDGGAEGVDSGDSADGDVEADGHGSVDFPPGASGQGDGVRWAGGFVFLSLPPVSPALRENQPPLFGSCMTNAFTVCAEGSTTTTFEERYPGQASPFCWGLPFSATGGSSGFPHAHRTRGTPWSSTRTAVPAWSTAW